MSRWRDIIVARALWVLGVPFIAFGPLPGYRWWTRVQTRRLMAWWKRWVLTAPYRGFHDRNFTAEAYSHYVTFYNSETGKETPP